MLEFPILEVPDFTDPAYAIQFQTEKMPGWYMAIQTWLAERGLALFEIKTATKAFAALPFPAYVILYGRTRSGMMHAIVGTMGEDGHPVAMMDPMGAGRAPGECFPDGYSSIAMLIPLDPSRLVAKPKTTPETRPIDWQ